MDNLDLLFPESEAADQDVADVLRDRHCSKKTGKCPKVGLSFESLIDARYVLVEFGETVLCGKKLYSATTSRDQECEEVLLVAM